MTEERWRRIRLGLVALFGAGYVGWFFTRGIIINHVLVLSSMALFFATASIGRPWQQWLRSARDYLLFAAMWLAYAESRGIADGLNFPIQVESVRNIDRAMFFGADGVVELQQRFLGPSGTVRWYDVVGSMVYYSHFIVPPVTIAVLWFVNRRHWVRYMRRFATLLFVACAMFVVVPTAPPWMAGDPAYGYNVLPELRRPTGNGWRYLGLDAAVDAWDTGRDWANPVAAMPSLHSAFSLFFVVFMFRWVTDWRWRAVMLLYPAAMAVSLMYFGEHYFADAVAGWLIVGASFWLWNRLETRWAERELLLEAEETATVDVELDAGGELGLVGAQERHD
jgi:membrane-associated phospholipid phosphatase